MPSLVALLPLVALATASTLPFPIASRQSTGSLFGPFHMPTVPINNVTIRLINFNDEVFDISNISIFGDVNDGGCTEPAEGPVEPSQRQDSDVVFGTAPMPSSGIQNAEVTLIDFNDEVFDVSNISIFGDVNDGTCPQA